MAMAEFQSRLRKHALKVVLLLGLGIGAGYVFSQIPPSVWMDMPAPFDKLPPPSAYESTASVFLNTAQPSDTVPYVRSTMQSQNVTPGIATLASTYTAYLKSDTFANRLIDQLALGVQPLAVTRVISTRLIPETNVLNITVRWDSPQGSQRIANSVAQMLVSGNMDESAGGSISSKLDGQAQYNEQQISQIQSELDQVQNDTSLTRERRAAEVLALRQQLLTVSDSYSRILGAQVANQAVTPGGSTPGMIFDRALEGQLSPKPWLAMLFGGVAGLVLGIGLVGLLEYVDATVDVAGELQQLLQAPILGTVSALQLVPSLQMGGRARLHPKLVTAVRPGSRAAEGFRLLRARVDVVRAQGAGRSLLITSARRGEGRTLIAANLAIAVAQSGKQVILVDGDLRGPNLHRLFGVPNTTGLTDLLAWVPQANGPQTDDLVHAVPSIPNLRILPAGCNPASETLSLSPESAADLLGVLSALADVVIVDAAPAALMADTLALASHVDGVIVVANARSTRRDTLEELCDVLAQVRANVIGGVLNRASSMAGVTRTSRPPLLGTTGATATTEPA